LNLRGYCATGNEEDVYQSKDQDSNHRHKLFLRQRLDLVDLREVNLSEEKVDQVIKRSTTKDDDEELFGKVPTVNQDLLRPR